MSAFKIIKGLANFLKLSGGTLTGTIDMGDNHISDIKSLAFNDGGATVTQVTDSDSLGTSDTVLCTQGNVKAYADTMLPLAGGTMTGNIILPVQVGHPTGSGTEGEIVISKTAGARATYRINVYIDSAWKYEILT